MSFVSAGCLVMALISVRGHLLPTGSGRPFPVDLSNMLYSRNAITLLDYAPPGTQSVEDFYTDMLSDLRVPVVRFDAVVMKRFKKIVSHRHVVMVVFETHEALMKVFDEPKPAIIDMSIESFFILVVTSYEMDCTEASLSSFSGTIFGSLWEMHRILDVSIYFPHLCQTLLKYDPISQNKVTILPTGSDPRKMLHSYKNMNGYPLVARVFERMPTMIFNSSSSLMETYLKDDISMIKNRGGIDGFILGNLVKALNFTPKVGPSSDGYEYGSKLPNGSVTGTLGDVLTRKADISFNGRFLKPYNTDGLEFTVPIFHDEFCVLAPKAQQIPAWRKIFLVFSLSTWCMFAGTTVVAGLIWSLMKIVSLRSFSTKTYPCWINFLEICLMIASQPIFLPSVSRERIFIAGCLIFSTIFSGIFQGYLNTAFSVISYYPDINSLQDLDESGLYVASSSGLDDIFGAGISNLMDNLQKKTKYTKTAARDLAAYDRSVCAVERKSDAKTTLEVNYMGNDGTPLLHVVNECPRSYYISYIVYKGYPFLPQINKFIRKISEAGLSDWWYSMNEGAIILSHRFHHAIEDIAWKKLSMIDVQTAFWSLIIGLITSLGAFFVEVLYFNLKLKYIHREKMVNQ